MPKAEQPYTAYIAGNRFTKYFDSAKGTTPESATAAVKRKNSPDWQDCTIWVTDDAGYYQLMQDQGM